MHQAATPLVDRMLLTIAPARDAASLGVLRIAAAGVGLFLTIDFWPGHFGAFPPELRFAPTGTAWAIHAVPVSDAIYQTSLIVFGVACVALLVGFRSRAAAWIAAGLSLYVGWVPALTGKVDHYHNVVWFLFILALFPSGDALSIDASRRLEPVRHREIAYAAPLALVSVLIGVTYLGAGLKKLSIQGLGWASENSLIYAMYNQAWEKNFTPPLWLAEVPGAASVAAIGALAFELFFVVAVLFGPSRKIARWVGLIFHWGTYYALGIGFWWLQPFYVVFFDWSRFDARRRTAKRVTDVHRASRAVAVALSAIVIGVSLAGLERAWPVASYPGFEQEATASIIDFEITTSEGERFFLSKSPFAERVRKRRVNWMAAEAFNSDGLGFLVPEIESSIGETITEIAGVVIRTVPGDRAVTARTLVWQR